MLKRKLRVLVLVAEPWRDDDGGGNTLGNFLNGMDAEFAQVYCSERMPVNNSCFRYFQMTDKEVVAGFFRHQPIGHELEYEVGRHATITSLPAKTQSGILSCCKRFRCEAALFGKQLVWFFSNWKTPALRKFITDFAPDVIYAPCYASPFMLELTRWGKNLTGKKVVTWSADDNYSLKQFSLSPWFWLRRFWVRHCLRQTYPYYDAFFSISEDEARELEPIVGKSIGILRKGIPLAACNPVVDSVHSPIRLIYAGGVYIERWRILARIGDALRRINHDGTRMVLNIYTQNTLTRQQRKRLDDGKNIFVHPAVDSMTLRKLYADSDIALHVESFSLKNRLTTRLSFSTKIVDCLASGCAVMAIAWKEQTGLKYLQRNDAAFCVTDEGKIEDMLRDILAHPEAISRYKNKARQLVLSKHAPEQIQNLLMDTFCRLAE